MRALIVDDDQGIRWILARVLQEEGYEVSQAETLAEATHKAGQQTPELIFLDVYLPDGSGLKAMQEGMFAAPVILMTAETTFDNAALAYKAGAIEYLPKPFDLDEVRSLARRIKPSDDTVSTDGSHSVDHDIIIGRSAVMQRLFRTLGKVAASDLTVLITGESGTGKELVAHILHDQSRRAKKPFVAINTAAIPSELLESELFGHERGAFTGADRSRPGKFEQADGGTLFLDEIGDMPPSLQVKLLRVLEEGRVQRVGSKESRPVNIRLLAATHQNLLQKIASGDFREDLYYRLNVIPVAIPALRDRKDDIQELAEHLLKETAEELTMQPPIMLDEALGLLRSYDWPGNVRELKNVMRRLAVLTPGATITLSDVALALGNHSQGETQEETLPEAVSRCLQHYFDHLGYARPSNLHRHLLEQVEPVLLSLVLERVKGNQIKAAEMLGLNRNTVRKLLKQYDIDPAVYRRS
ncbi:MAG: sigma-54-dependent transcriptional regulator [Mariprofundaceae bacterium]